ncbi:hypothetical protein ACFTAO_09575 [Paenibacillus rhizoplanae]
MKDRAEQMQHALLYVNHLRAACGERLQEFLQQPVRLLRFTGPHRLNQPALQREGILRHRCTLPLPLQLLQADDLVPAPVPAVAGRLLRRLERPRNSGNAPDPCTVRHRGLKLKHPAKGSRQLFTEGPPRGPGPGRFPVPSAAYRR